MIDNVNHMISAHSSHLHCIIKLVQRRLLVFYRDKTDFYITFGQAPVLVAAFFLVFNQIITLDQSSLFSPLRSYLSDDTVSLIIFLAVLTAVWFGTSKAIIEIPSSKILYRQEHLSFLNNTDYILSIFISLSLIAFVQILLFVVGFYFLFVFIPAIVNPFETGLTLSEAGAVSFIDTLMPVFLIKFIALMWVIAMASIALALFISVFISTPSAASAILPFVLIVQILMSGSAIQPIKNMNEGVRFASNFMVSRWGFEATVLLFEKELNFNTLRYKKQDNEFNKFSFSGSGILGLKKTKSENYFKSLDEGWKLDNKSIYPSLVIDIKHYKALVLWYEAIAEVIDKDSVDNMGIEKNKKEKLIKLEPLLSKIKYNISLLKKEKKINNKYQKIKNSAIEKIFLDKAKENFLGSQGSYRKKIKKVFSNPYMAQAGLGKAIFSHAVSLDSELKLFRMENNQKTWSILYIMIFSFLIFTKLFFNRSRKKEKMFF